MDISESELISSVVFKVNFTVVFKILGYSRKTASLQILSLHKNISIDYGIMADQ